MDSKWIDIKEQMPEYKKWCWVWIEYDDGSGEGYCTKMFLNTSGKWMANTLSQVKDEFIDWIKAWQVYYEPEPYKRV